MKVFLALVLLIVLSSVAEAGLVRRAAQVSPAKVAQASKHAAQASAHGAKRGSKALFRALW